MTTEAASIGGDSRLQRLMLLVPPALVLLVAAITPTAALHPDQRDVLLYLEKARALTSGLVPYRDFPLEYPPAALIAMVVPYLAGLSERLSLDAYKVLFAGWEAFLLLALGLVIGRIGERLGEERTAWRLIVVAIGAALSITWRYDLFPTLLVMLAVWAAIERRPAVVGLAVGLGVLAKLYPVSLLPALAIPWLRPFDLGRLTRLGASFGLTVLLGLLPFVAMAGDDAFGFLTYQVGRGLQIESVGGGFVLLAGLLGGEPARLSYGFGAVQVEGPLAQALLGLLPGITVLGAALLGWLGWRRVRDTAEAPATDDASARALLTIAFASLLLVLVTSKVYSIQYVVWILPFVALLRGWPFWLGAAIVALTMPIHPVLYTDLVAQKALPILVLNLRNALVLALMVWVFADTTRSRPRELTRQAKAEGSTVASAPKRA